MKKRLFGVSVLGVFMRTAEWTHAFRIVIDLLANLDPVSVERMDAEEVVKFRTRRMFAKCASHLSPGRNENASEVTGGWWVNMNQSPAYVEKTLQRIAAWLGWQWGRDIQLVYVGESPI